MRWAAIDFETATRERASACAVGVVLIDDGLIVDQQSWLIRPPGNDYEPWNIKVHGITPDQTESASAFDVVWAEVEPMVLGRTIFAHNAGFDMGVLRGASDLTGAPVGDHRYACTVSLARRAWPDLGRYNLPMVCNYLGIDLFNHHDALADALACGEIAVAVTREIDELEIDAMAAEFNQIRGGPPSSPDGYKARPRTPRRNGKSSGPPAYLQNAGKPPPPNPNANKSHPLCESHIVFTGDLQRWTRTEVTELAAAHGALCRPNVTKKTSYLVVSDSDYGQTNALTMTSKLRRALELVAAGTPIQIIPETDFANLLERPS